MKTTKSKYKARQKQDIKTLGLIHLGCPKNQVDSEEMLAALAQDGWTLTGDADSADVLVVNTCGFIDAAKEESMQAIRDAVQKKQDGKVQKVVVAGCLAQRYAKQIADDVPGVDAVIGLGNTAQLPEYVRSTFLGERPVISSAPPPEWQELSGRLLTTPQWTSYIKIGEGCDHKCSFCAIPSFRGDWRSRPPVFLLEELRQLAEGGLKEAILIGQDTTLYGTDFARNGSTFGDWSLPKLVREIGKIPAIRWQRIMYAHPGRVNQELIDLYGDVENLAPYIDMPFQHGDNAVLKRMKRAGNTGRYLEVVQKLRERLPKIAIRSTFLLGFPGETDEEFERTCDFVRQAQLDHVGVFVYSEEDSTSAFQMQNDVPREIAEERAARLMEIQAEISEKRLRSLVGTTLDVLVESELGGGQWLCRSERDVPEIDSNVVLVAKRARIGQIIKATVTDSSTHDLVAEPAGLGAGRQLVQIG